MTYIGDWEKMTERMGFWVNLDEAYYTLNNTTSNRSGTCCRRSGTRT